MKFVIEHADNKVYEWSLIEYKHISKLVGRDNLIICNVKNEELNKIATISQESVKELGFQNACVLDPKAEKTLSPEDKFDYLIFGGILGDYPPQKRTENLLPASLKAERRNLGDKQMPTDNAVYTAKLISEGTKFEKIPFKDDISIGLEKNLDIELPFRYVLVNGKPLVSEKLIKYLKKREEV